MSMSDGEPITLRLSDVVFNHPLLYDTRHKDHNNKQLKDETWEAVGLELRLPVLKVKAKWKNLRDSYIKYLRSLHCTAGVAQQKYMRWQWSSQMEKFKPFLFSNDNYKPRIPRVPALTDQDLSSDLDTDRATAELLRSVTKREPDPLHFLEESEEESDYHHHLLNPQSLDGVQSSTDDCPPKKVRRTEPLIDFGESIECSKPTNVEVELDVVDHLMLAYAKTIKRFSLRRQAETKLQIAQLIMRQELEEIEERQQVGNAARCAQL